MQKYIEGSKIFDKEYYCSLLDSIIDDYSDELTVNKLDYVINSLIENQLKAMTLREQQMIEDKFYALNECLDIDPLTLISEIPATFLAFRKDIEEVVIPGNVKTIGDSFAADSKNLKSIVIENGPSSITLQTCFAYNSKIENVSIKRNEIVIEASFLEKCKDLQNICFASADHFGIVDIDFLKDSGKDGKIDITFLYNKNSARNEDFESSLKKIIDKNNSNENFPSVKFKQIG